MPGQDFTQGVEGLKIGNTHTTLSGHKRHCPMQGNMINRDEFEPDTFGTIRVGEGENLYLAYFDPSNNPSGRELIVTPEAYYYEGDGETWLRLRENSTGKLVGLAGHWMKMRDEWDCNVEETLLKPQRYVTATPSRLGDPHHQNKQIGGLIRNRRWEGFKSFYHSDPDTGYLVWFKGLSDVIHSEDSGWWLNAKRSGRHLLLAFSDSADFEQRRGHGRPDLEDEESE
jgi:hypothetical protein